MTAAEEVKSKLDIVDLVGEYVRLMKGGGQSMKALCPFHQEKTPSFYVHRDRQFFHCFGCGESGDLFTFYQKAENLEFPDALRELARRAGVSLPDHDPKAGSERAAALAVLEDAAKFYQAALRHEVGGRAREYLAGRGLKEATLQEFGIGYAPNSWEALVSALAKKGHDLRKIVDAGMAVPSDRGRAPYDRFRDRVMIPIRDEKGVIVGFTGRIMPDNPEAERTGKYVNTPETAVFHKKRVVFALDRAREHVKAANFAVLVEGQMDAISSHEAGVKNVVAVSGTAFTEEQIDLLKRFCGRIAIAFDADIAGKNALAKSLPHAWKNGLQVLVIVLPEGFKDPDEVVRKDPELWRRAIAEAKDMVAWSVDNAMSGVRQDDPFSKKQALAALKPVFALLADPVLHAHWVHVLAEKMGLAEEAVMKELSGTGRPEAGGRESKFNGQKSNAKGQMPGAERRETLLALRLLTLILNLPERFLAKVRELDHEWIPEGYSRELVKMLKARYSGRDQSLLRPQEVFSWFEDLKPEFPDMPSVEHLAMLKERDMSGWTDEDLEREFAACAEELAKLFRGRRAKELVAAVAEAERSGDAESAARLARRLEELKKSGT